MGAIRGVRGFALAATFAALAVHPPLASANVHVGNLELGASVGMQHTFQTDSFDNAEWVQWRNELRFEGIYNALPYGQPFGLLDVAKVSLLWRARYDPVFELRDRYQRRGFDRDDFRFPEGKTPRELYVDLDFNSWLDDLSLRIGRQQVVWGEADLFRSLDQINPLRTDQNGLIGEDLDDYREPLWIAKGLYSLKALVPGFTGGFAEFFYSPNWRPLTNRALVSEALRLGVDENNFSNGFQRPPFIPFYRSRHPWEITRIGPDRTDGVNELDLLPQQGALRADFIYGIDNDSVPSTTLSLDASMAGIRFFGQTFGGLDVSLNYLWKPTDIPSISARISDLFDPTILPNTGLPNPRVDLTAQAVAASLTPDTDGNGVPDGSDDLVRRCIDNLEPVFIVGSIHGNGNALSGCELLGLYHPQTHILGATGTYNDASYTGAIFRFEGSFSTKEGRIGSVPLLNERAGDYPRTRDFESHLKRNVQVTRTMIGFDYIRTIWPQPPLAIRRSRLGTLLYDNWFFSFQFFNQYLSNTSNILGLTNSATDRESHFSPTYTFLMTGFFDKDRLRPFWAFAYDQNSKFPVAWIQFTYAVTEALSVRVAHINYIGSRHAEGPLFLNKYADRDTSFVRFTYELL